MTLSELKRNVDFAAMHLSKHLSPDEVTVLITTAEMSMGPRSSDGVKSAGMCFDFEAGEYRLNPVSGLVHVGNCIADRKKRYITYVHIQDVGPIPHFFCPTCSTESVKKDNFCKNCGQAFEPIEKEN